MEYQEATGFRLRALGVNDFPTRAPPVRPDFGATRADRLIKNNNNGPLRSNAISEISVISALRRPANLSNLYCAVVWERVSSH